MQGNLFIITAASGTGKTTLVNALLAAESELRLSISYTTRPIRPNERDGVHYHFVTSAVFEEMVHAGAFLEYANVFGHYYGTSKQWVETQLQNNIDVLLEIDWQGARQIRERLSQAIGVFILPPSHAVLEERLKHRRQDNPEVIQKRLAAAHEEIAHYHEFDYVVVNDIFQQALVDLQAVIKAARLKRERQALQLKGLLAEL